MLVLQQLDVLPAGSNFSIVDENKIELEGFISESDHSLCFHTAYESDKYHKVYSTFRVVQLTTKLGALCNGEYEIDYVIKVR